MNDDIARSDLASCGTRRMRAKLLRRLHWLVCVRLHKHILPMDFASFKSLPLSPLSGTLPPLNSKIYINGWLKRGKSTTNILSDTTFIGTNDNESILSPFPGFDV